MSHQSPSPDRYSKTIQICRHDECDWESMTDDERKSNAQLIAAAPDLLAACQRAYECCYDKNSEDGMMLKAAIAKAIGPQR